MGYLEIMREIILYFLIELKIFLLYLQKSLEIGVLPYIYYVLFYKILGPREKICFILFF